MSYSKPTNGTKNFVLTFHDDITRILPVICMAYVRSGYLSVVASLVSLLLLVVDYYGRVHPKILLHSADTNEKHVGH